MGIRWTRTINPSVEPVSVAEAKAHLRIDISEDDWLLENLIQAAREYIEDATGRALINQTWRLVLDEWPDSDCIQLPRPPLSAKATTGITYTDSGGTERTFSADCYDVDTDSEPGCVVLAYGHNWPTATLARMNPIKITYVAGYGATVASVPEHLRQAILLLLGHWYENREGIIVGQGFTQTTVPLAIDSLIKLNQVRFWR